MYPTDDEFEEVKITEASVNPDKSWNLTREDDWSFYVDAEDATASGIEPKACALARFYGKGIGFGIRGLFLDGQKVFYRTVEEEKEKHEIDTYGRDARDWLNRWDSGSTVWSIEMGGLGPGYEQCIHITCAEILRHMLDVNYDHTKWKDREVWDIDSKAVDTAGFGSAVIKKLGLSGAQWGAAKHLALKLYRFGPRTVLTDIHVRDRHIQVERRFPAIDTADTDRLDWVERNTMEFIRHFLSTCSDEIHGKILCTPITYCTANAVKSTLNLRQFVDGAMLVNIEGVSE